MFIYGGSWNMGSRGEYGFVGSALASRGFVTVIADYRLVPEVRFPDFLQDGALALRWARDNIAAHGGDPARIGLAGHSAGAYNAVMLALDPRHLRAVGLTPGALKGVVGLAGPTTSTLDVGRGRSRVRELAESARDAAHQLRPRRRAAPAAGDRRRGYHRAPAQHGGAGRAHPGRRRPGRDAVYPGVGHVDILTGIARLTRRRGQALDDMDAFFKARL